MFNYFSTNIAMAPVELSIRSRRFGYRCRDATDPTNFDNVECVDGGGSPRRGRSRRGAPVARSKTIKRSGLREHT